MTDDRVMLFDGVKGSVIRVGDLPRRNLEGGYWMETTPTSVKNYRKAGKVFTRTTICEPYQKEGLTFMRAGIVWVERHVRKRLTEGMIKRSMSLLRELGFQSPLLREDSMPVEPY